MASGDPPVDYAWQIYAHVYAVLSSCTTEKLVALGAIAQVTAEQYPVPEGRLPYAFYEEGGYIQQAPEIVKLQAAAFLCPCVFERKAIAWIMKHTGGTVDPARAKVVWNQVRTVLAEADVADANVADANVEEAKKVEAEKN